MATHLPGKSHGQRSLAGYSPWGCKSDLETKPTPCLTWRPSLDMPCFLASVTSSGCRWEDPWVPWQQANCHGHVPIYNPLSLQSFLLFTFIQGLLGVGSVLHNKTIGGNCGTPDLRKPRWRNQSSIKVVIWLPIGVKGDQSTWPRPCCCSVAQSFLTVFNPMDCNIPGFLPFIISWNLFKLMSIELVIQSKHLNFCHPLFLLPSQSFPASGSFPVSRLFTSGGQSTGVSASASVLPVNIQGWFPLGWLVWSCNPRDSEVFKSVTVSIFSPSICHEVMGPDAMILVFWMLSFKPALSLSSFTFIKRLFS